MNPELAQTVEDIENRALVRGQQLMHAPADKLLELCKLAKASGSVSIGEPIECDVAAFESKISELEAKLAEQVAINGQWSKTADDLIGQKDAAKNLIAELEAKLAAAPAPVDVAPLEAKIAELEAKLAAVPPAVDVAAIEAPLNEKIAALEKKLAALIAAS